MGSHSIINVHLLAHENMVIFYLNYQFVVIMHYLKLSTLTCTKWKQYEFISFMDGIVSLFTSKFITWSANTIIRKPLVFILYFLCLTHTHILATHI